MHAVSDFMSKDENIEKVPLKLSKHEVRFISSQEKHHGFVYAET